VLDRALLAAVAKIESNFNPFAISPRGACGILQLMPATAKRFGVKSVFDVEQNIEGGAAYLRFLLDRFGGRVDLALAGYNAGEGAVDRHHGIPPFAETQWYVIKVLDKAAQTGQSAPR
jgi:soluble lytic murein transglycosylase-like protein